MHADTNGPSDLQPWPTEASRVETYTLRGVSVLLARMETNGDFEAVKQLIPTMPDISCYALAVMRTIGNVRNCIFILRHLWYGSLRKDGFQRCIISDNAYRTIAIVPMYNKEIIAFLLAKMIAAFEGKLVINPEDGTDLSKNYLKGIWIIKMRSVMSSSEPGVLWTYNSQ